MKSEDIIIIGGGASGLMAAVTAAMYAPQGTDILIIEHKSSVGKKLLATGNGRCNYTNDVLNDTCYRGNDPSFAYKIIEQYDKEWLLATLESLGIVHTKINGYYYPRSLQASTVVDHFVRRLESAGVRIHYSTHVDSINVENDGFTVYSSNGNYKTERIIVATGGRSYEKLGSDGSGYQILKRIGHNLIDTYPALTGIICEGLDFKLCHGVRAKGKLELYVNNRREAVSEGEIQFADYGISGIPVFEISRYASVALGNKSNIQVVCDLLPEYNINRLAEQMISIVEQNPYTTAVELLASYLPLKLAKAILKMSGINGVDRVSVNELCAIIKNIKVFVKGTTGYDRAQVTAGGIDTSEISNETMESKLFPGLYITGELLDIDGTCGGYNLHFAFATGYVAGMSAALSL